VSLFFLFHNAKVTVHGFWCLRSDVAEFDILRHYRRFLHRGSFALAGCGVESVALAIHGASRALWVVEADWTIVLASSNDGNQLGHGELDLELDDIS
jgi:hypothetical protein